MKKVKDNPWLLFATGLILGLIIYAAYTHFNPSQPAQSSEEVTIPVNFDISAHDHILGNYDAPVTFVVFNDFACPYCKEYALNLEKLTSAYPDRVRIVWKHFPLNPDDFTPSIASECADEQGEFWSYAQKLYSYPSLVDSQNYLQFATELDLNQNQFDTCLLSDKYRAKVEADYYEGIIKGVVGAPATFVNGEYIPGAIPYSRLEEIVGGLI